MLDLPTGGGGLGVAIYKLRRCQLLLTFMNPYYNTCALVGETEGERLNTVTSAAWFCQSCTVIASVRGRQGRGG